MEKLYTKYENDNNVQVELRESIIMRVDIGNSRKSTLKNVFTKDNLYIKKDEFDTKSILLTNLSDATLFYLDIWMRYIRNPETGIKIYPTVLDIESDIRNEYMSIWLEDETKTEVPSSYYRIIPYSLLIEKREVLFRIVY